MLHLCDSRAVTPIALLRFPVRTPRDSFAALYVTPGRLLLRSFILLFLLSESTSVASFPANLFKLLQYITLTLRCESRSALSFISLRVLAFYLFR